ncbi:MAG: D-tyrosyl-tRNA(Tyr) deacylase [candidate division Zixibacteria bacterium]|nr:D-tyrosyl-tRNA(Tyr) deacylase [candidate division Zixibacteria bacterium]
MRVLLQRVSRASVAVDGNIVGAINRGLLVLCGFKKNDDESSLYKIADKCLNLRIFEDAEGKMNRSLLDINGELLVVSQFTLYANCRKGRRPSFDISMPPESAEALYENLLTLFEQSGLKVARGRFGVKMAIELTNDGPVTVLLDNDEL